MTQKESMVDAEPSSDKTEAGAEDMEIGAEGNGGVEPQDAESQTPPDANASDQELSTEKKEETQMADDNKTESTAIELSHGSAVLGNRPIADNEFEISSTITFSGVRPIESSSLDIYDTMMGGRPIEASHLAVVDTDTIPGHRPIFASAMAVIDADTLPGHRPIAASPEYLMQGSELPNNRPIAANTPEPGNFLMGYLD